MPPFGPTNEEAFYGNIAMELRFERTSVHVVNGRVNMILTGLRHKIEDRELPLTRGRIQFQSEAAEVFYRNIALRRISELPTV